LVNELKVTLPRRADLPNERSVLIISYSSFRNKKFGFFFLLQSEFGDLYKLTIQYSVETGFVNNIIIKYFDTIPPCISLCIMKTGYLFAASEFGNHALYKFIGLGESGNVETSAYNSNNNHTKSSGPLLFNPRGFENLEPVHEMYSFSPIVDMKVENLLSEEEKQIFIACGRGSRSSLRLLRMGLSVQESVCANLPEHPSYVFTLRMSKHDRNHKYIAVSFDRSTMVLGITDGIVNQIYNSGLQLDVSTLRLQLMFDDSFVQIHSRGVRQIMQDKRIREWSPPINHDIENATCNDRQVILVLNRCEIVYLELEPNIHQLVERESKKIHTKISAIDICPNKDASRLARFFALADQDKTIRLFSLDKDSLFRQISVQFLETAFAISLLFMDLYTANSDTINSTNNKKGLILQAGLSSGILMQIELDHLTGQIKESRWKFLGLQPPKLVQVKLRNSQALIALSSRPWMGYLEKGKFMLSSLCYDSLDWVTSFSSEENVECLVAIAGSKNTTKDSSCTLRFFQPKRLGEPFNQQVMKLKYTPRSMVVHSEKKMLIMCESEHGTSLSNQNKRTSQNFPSKLEDCYSETNKIQSLEEKTAHYEQFGFPIGNPSTWSSCLRIIDPRKMLSIFCTELDNDEAAISMTLIEYNQTENSNKILALSTARDLSLTPRKAAEWFIRLYRITCDGTKMELIHKTGLEDSPTSLAPFYGRLLVGVGTILRLYDIGKKRLLRKCEFKQIPNLIISIQHMGRRIYIADNQDSVHFIKFHPDENEFNIYAEDCIPRYLTSLCLLDYDTVVVGDKFGNLTVLRLPADISSKIEDCTTGKVSMINDYKTTPFKVEVECNFHVGDIITTLQKTTLLTSGTEVILYSTLCGSIASLIPLSFKEDIHFYQHLELHMRQEAPSLVGRDHLSFRSYYFPCRKVIDGDLCETFSMVSSQEAIAAGIGTTVGEVLKRLDETRNKVN
jgi:splicing factor 3B subunit 3